MVAKWLGLSFRGLRRHQPMATRPVPDETRFAAANPGLCDLTGLLGGTTELAEHGRQLMAGAAALQLDLVAALHYDGEFLPAPARDSLDRGDPLQRHVAEVVVDLVKHRIRAPDVQGIGREPEHHRG